MPKTEVVTLQLSSRSILKVIGILMVLGFLFLISEVLGIIFIALVLASALEPVISWLARRGLHRILATVLIYFLIFVVLFGVVFVLVPPLTKEASAIANHFPYYYNKIIQNLVSFSGNQLSRETAQQLLPATSATTSEAPLTNTIFNVFGGLIGFILVWVIAFYFIAEEKGLKQFVGSISSTRSQGYYLELLNKIRLRTGSWLRGQLVTSLIVGILYYIGLRVLGVPYALLLAVLGSAFEIIVYLAVQQLESLVITPRILSERFRPNPLLSIIVILIGLKVAGVFGAILAVPITTAVMVVITDIVNNKLPQEN
ncbi:MAG: AI-2E family transporter [Candidatus Komeilibacteria bacterium]|nr:AI-2E family transporter [Candidatus Komeilibacteria bacterium]